MKLKSSTLVVTLLAIASLLIAVAYTVTHVKAKHHGGAKPAEQSPPHQSGQAATAKHRASKLPPVRIDVVAPKVDSYPAHIIGYGEVHAQYEVDYTAQVTGQVTWLHPAFEVGNQVKRGQLLAKVADAPYQQALGQAKAKLADAQLTLYEEQRMAQQAKLEWQQSGLNDQPSSPLVLRQPQLDAAIAHHQEAKLAVIQAGKDLAHTKITAPFDALIIQRNIQPGSNLQPSQQVATLYSINRAEIAISLSKQQWQNLPALTNREIKSLLPTHWPVDLYDTDGQHHWRGYLLRIAKHLDSETRQRQIIVALDDPLSQADPLYAGTFIKASLQGKVLENTWKLPASVISQQGEIWYVDQQNRLRKAAAHKLFEYGKFVYLQPIADLKDPQIIKRPLNHYVAGMPVAPVVTQ